MCCPNCCTNKPKAHVAYTINTSSTADAVREIRRQERQAAMKYWRR